MNTFRVDLHCANPLRFSVVRLNSKFMEMEMMTYRPNLKAAIADGEFFGTEVIVTPAARRAAGEQS